MWFRLRGLSALALVWTLGTGCQDECDEIEGQLGDQIRGEIVYSNHCAECHGDEGQGISGPALTEVLFTLTNCEIIETVRAGPGVMPASSETDVSTEDMVDLLGYITLQFR